LWLFAAGWAIAETPPAAVTPDPFGGLWVGTVAAPNQTTDISFAFTPGKHGLNARITMPAMWVNGMFLGPAQIVDGTYTLPELGIRLTRAGDRLTGTFANPLLQVDLHRAVQPLPVPPAPVLPPGPAPLWSHALGALVWASPAARDGVVYVGSVDGKFHALSARDGTELWTWSDSNPLYGEALVTADRLWFVDGHTELVCLNRTDGHLLWRAPLHDAASTTGATSGNETFNRRVPVPVLADGTDSPSNGAPGWVPGGDYARPWNPRDGQWPGATDGDATPSTIPDGQNAAIIAGGSGGWDLSQVLASTFQAGASYYFIMNAGARLDEGGGYDANYRFQILRGDTHEVLAEEGGHLGASDRGTWKECMVGYVATAGVAGVPIEIRAMNIGPGWQLSVDNARLLENLAGGPRLTIVPSAGSVTLSWPVSFTGYILESATALPATTWTAVAGVVNNSVTLGASAGNGFFRLRKP